MSALGGILLTSLLHGEIFSVLGAGFQYWIMQPVFFNMLQVRGMGYGAPGGRVFGLRRVYLFILHTAARARARRS